MSSSRELKEPGPELSGPGWRLNPKTPYAIPHIFSGRVCFVMFQTSEDLTPFVPYPLELVDPRKAFLKIYQLKYRPVGLDPKPPAFSQYTQVCLCVLAAPPGQEVGHYNLLLWEARDWSLGGSEPNGWRKKLANIEVSNMFPTADRYDADDGTDCYQAEIHQFGHPILNFQGNLSGGGVADPGFTSGFYSVRYQKDGDPALGTATAEVTRIAIEDPYLGPPTTGTGELSIVPGVGYNIEEVAMLEACSNLTVEGVVLRDVGWRRDAPQSTTFTYPGSAT